MDLDKDPTFQVRQCLDEGCRFRFPVKAESLKGERCPQCGAGTVFVTAPFGGHAVERLDFPIIPTPIIEALLDNIRSAFNVGAIFRTADAAAIAHLHLCGMTATPDQTLDNSVSRQK